MDNIENDNNNLLGNYMISQIFYYSLNDVMDKYIKYINKK